MSNSAFQITLPKSWPTVVRSAMLHVVSLAKYAAVYNPQLGGRQLQCASAAPGPTSRLPSFTGDAHSDPARPTSLTRCMNRTFPMYAARMHVHSLIPGTAPAADLSQDMAAVNAGDNQISRNPLQRDPDWPVQILAASTADAWAHAAPSARASRSH